MYSLVLVLVSRLAWLSCWRIVSSTLLCCWWRPWKRRGRQTLCSEQLP